MTPVLAKLAIDKALSRLVYQNMGLRERMIELSAPGTCAWPLDHPEYQA
jgi:hypothetical protein